MPTASSTFIYIGNFVDLDPDETNFTNENPNAIFKTFDRDDMSVVTVVQNDANGDGLVQENDRGQTPDTFTYDIGGGSVTSGLDNAARYSVDYVDETGNTQSTTVSAYQTETGDVFLRFPNDLKVSSVTIKEVSSDGYANITHAASSTTEVVCFAPGTLISCPDTPRPVETLGVGDLVNTLQHGPQPIRWIHHGTHPLEGVARQAMPVMIRTGALGPGFPSKDLVVSPHHRIFVGGNGQLENYFPTEALAPAKSLTALRGIRYMMGKKEITWRHIAFDKHEVISANGCWAESLLLGPMVLQGLTLTKRRILNDMYGPVKSGGDALNGPTSYACLSVGQAQQHIAQMSLVEGQGSAA
ncbi:Hint domain-containing protein [uncultured Roseobacter sp.]|uniref:Hint domain-containing protein n=1 Tax=uncultured Roseobacter sp. TaxID=114847 RepID=UPI0026053284|nr:Hint domain-containing protein [uncultured Roseobacter sp.]